MTVYDRVKGVGASTTIALLSLLISISGTCATIYYNFFWRPEELLLSYRVRHGFSQNLRQATFVFTNTGTQSIVVEDVRLEGRGDLADACSKEDAEARNIAERRLTSLISNTISGKTTYLGEDVQNTMADIRKYRSDSSVLFFITNRDIIFPSLKKVVIDSNEVQSSTLLVPAESVKVMDQDYEMPAEDKKWKVENYCFRVSFFERSGAYRVRVFPAWTVKREGDSTVLDFGKAVKQVSLIPSR